MLAMKMLVLGRAGFVGYLKFENTCYRRSGGFRGKPPLCLSDFSMCFKSGQMVEALWVPWILLPGQSTKSRSLAMAHLSIIFDRKQINRSLDLLFSYWGRSLTNVGLACKSFARARIS